VQATVPGAWNNVTLISGMRNSGVVAPLALPGATDRLVFETYVEKAFVPELRAGDVRGVGPPGAPQQCIGNSGY